MGAEQVIVRGDSQLVIEQIEREYETRGEKLREYCQIARSLARKFSKVELQRIPRLENKEANRLARVASLDKLDPIVSLKILDSPSIRTPELNAIETEASWAKLIRDYLELGALPEDKLEARRIRFRASHYVLFNGVLYKRGHTLPLLRCATEEEVTYIIREIHEGICENHSRGRSLANKILRAAYYCTTMSKDSMAFVKKCDKCQRFSNIPRQPAHQLTRIHSPWPSAQ